MEPVQESVESDAPGDDREYRYTDEELVKLIDRCVERSETGETSAIDTERTLVQEYYQGARPLASDSNTSDYVSYEVFDTVEDMKGKMIKTFCSNKSVVRFEPNSEDDVEQADARTKFVHKVFYTQNRGFKVLHDLFHDAFMAALCVTKTWYRKSHRTEVREFSNVPVQQLQAAAMRDDVLEIAITDQRWQDRIVPTPMGAARTRELVASGEVTLKTDTSKIEVRVFAPEGVHFSSPDVDISDPDSIPMVVLVYRVPRYALLQDGYDPEVVAKLKPATAPQSGSANARASVGSGSAGFPSEDIATPLDMIEIREATVWLDMDTDEPTLWNVVKSGPDVLGKERVSSSQLRFWTPYMVSHKAIGLSPGMLAVDLQAGKSQVVRGMIDNIHRVNAGVRTANMDLIRNPGDLIDNPIGGIIDTPRPMDAISVAPQAPLSPATGALLEVMTVEKEQRTGSTRLGRGLNTQDVITHQNAADMISELIEVGSDRPTMLARSFAELMLRPLLMDIWDLAVENDVEVSIEIDGVYRKVRASQLGQGDEMSIDVALTPDQGDAAARKVLTAHQLLGGDPQLAPLYGMEERYKLMSHVFHLLAMPNWLPNPKDPKVQQRLAMAQQKRNEMEQMGKAMAIKEMQLKERDVAAKELTAQGGLKLDKEGLNLDAAQGAADQNLKEREFRWQVATDVAELKLEEKQARAVAIGDNRTPKV